MNADRPLLHAGKRRVFDDDGRVERAPRVLVEIAADHLAVLRPLRERDRRAVDADEAFAVVMDEGQEVGLLAGVHLERAAGVEDDRVEVVQILRVVFELLLRERLGVGADHRVPQAGLFAEALDRDHRVRHGFVSIALFFADHQQALARRLDLCDDRCAGHKAHGHADG